MKVVSGLVAAFMTTARAGNYVVSVENALAFCQIEEQDDRRLAFVTSHDNIPCALLRLNHWGIWLSGTMDLVQAGEPGSPSQFFSQKQYPELSACDCNHKIGVCPVADTSIR
jgi:hypothetical protein